MSAAVVSAGAGAVVTVSFGSVVSAGLDPQKVRVNAKNAQKPAANTVFNDFFMISGLNLAFIPKTGEGHPMKHIFVLGYLEVKIVSNRLCCCGELF